MACGMEHQNAECCSMRAMLTSTSFLKPFAHLKGERKWELLVAHDGAPPHRNAVPSASLTTLRVVLHCPSSDSCASQNGRYVAEHKGEHDQREILQNAPFRH